MTEYIWVSTVALLAVVLAVLVFRVRLVYTQRPRYAKYWRDGNGDRHERASIHLVMLGDSLMQGIGASKPIKGLAGLAAAHVAQRTGRTVRITNLSRTGAKVAEVLTDQLPGAPLEEADIVLVCVSANDAFNRVPLPEYRRSL
ncbi:MAG: GDSL-type esterase/lipase family protein, partial [Pseudonocardiaceae bacterium]